MFPKDGLTAIAVEGLSTSESAKPGKEAEDVADLVLYYGGENFERSAAVQTAQFKYKTTEGTVTASYLKKTIEKFAESIVGYNKHFSTTEVDDRLTFSFVTNAQFSDDLWAAIGALQSGTKPTDGEARSQFDYLSNLCKKKKIDAQRLFARTEFRAAEADLPTQNKKLRRTIADWSAGTGDRAGARLLELTELIREKAGPRGQSNNLVKREDVLIALNCEPEDLFPAETRFIAVGEVVPRAQLEAAKELIETSTLPVFIHADGGVGKTVFAESLASASLNTYEVVVFDCFGGGAYRSPDQARHRPSVGFVQIVNELASRGLCDPLLPGDADTIALVRTARRRLVQAASAIRSQSTKFGILIVIDAADNAQLEADNRKEDAFPSLLLASLNNEGIDGVKLVLTARPHRMANVIKRSKVMPFALLPFTTDEARSFLEARRRNILHSEFALAYSRSEGNARVLAYLVDTWDVNVAAGAPSTTIKVEELIAQKCQKIFDDLHVAGWSDDDVKEFFAAISLLPPPVPLGELASALGWEDSQAKSAASDLAPMLDLVPQGAIFRDEPTETYIHDSYSNENSAQQAIAERLLKAQETSTYAAEALPNFLVAINDSSRSYALANSTKFPKTIQSDFGRRRLQLARLNAAFKMAVKEHDIDRTLKLAMLLAQVSAANDRGDEFIRRSPGLAVALGDPDAYRRLFNDRSGWRGARDARLTIAHAFSGEVEEAEIHCDRTIGWINWHAELPHDENEPMARRNGPDSDDFASAVFISILNGTFEKFDGNLVRWNRRFALSVCRKALTLIREFERVTGKMIINDLAAFAASAECKSFELKISLLQGSALSSKRRKALARSIQRSPIEVEDDDARYDDDQKMGEDTIYAAFAALLHHGEKSAAKILRSTRAGRASSYDYGERYGHSKVWLPTLYACVSAWAQKRQVAIHDLLPRQVKITPKAKLIGTLAELCEFLSALPAPRPRTHDGKLGKRIKERLFDDRECKEISKAIETIMSLVEPVQTAVLSGTTLPNEGFAELIANWAGLLPSTDYGHTEEAHVVIRRIVGLGLARLLLFHSESPSTSDIEKLIQIVSGKRFLLRDQLSIIKIIACKPGLVLLAGKFAGAIAENIKKDDYIEQRGANYLGLSQGLLEMSPSEAKRYYRDGLSQLDQLGSDDYDLIYELLNYAARQPGGLISPMLGHRLMNLSQTICHHEPRKFGWTLFARACAKSIGTSAMTKLVRWDDQDIADFSYGLPQLACFLAAEGRLHPKRAAAILLICEDHGWYEWRIGDGLQSLLRVTHAREDQRKILDVVIAKLKREHGDGGWPSVWESLVDISAKFPGLLTSDEIASLDKLRDEAQRKQDEANARSSGGSPGTRSFNNPNPETDPNAVIQEAFEKFDFTSSSDIDDALRELQNDKNLPYYTRREFFEGMREACPYNQRSENLFALSESSTIDFDNVIDLIVASTESWKSTSAFIIGDAKRIVEHLFHRKGSEFFDIQYLNIRKQIDQLTVICGDRRFVIDLLLNTVVSEKLELEAKDWLQLATELSTEAGPASAREALEEFLSGPAAGISDDIGEGPYQNQFELEDRLLVPGIFFHLLGDSDAYVRWGIARSIGGLAELGLIEDLETLLDIFDHRSIPALASADQNLSFENSQQWLLMGLSRATLHQKQDLVYLTTRLLKLAARDDIHILNKKHILRCLLGLEADENKISPLKREVEIEQNGVSIAKGWPKHVDPKSGFKFDYEFAKSEVQDLARLFHIADGTSTDAIGHEITRKWPSATSMDYFPGRDRYRRERSDRYEFFREQIQKHALLSAATTLRKTHPVVRQSYDQDSSSPFDDFIREYDVTFSDGSWLADQKDEEPSCAKCSFTGQRVDHQETLVEVNSALSRMALTQGSAMVPVYGTWKSPDGVHVRIVTGLTNKRGVVGRCEAFSKRNDHALWIPMFWHGGYDDENRQESPFEPFIWAPDAYNLGIDKGEKEATTGAAARARLGIDLTSKLGLTPDSDMRLWTAPDTEVALRSQVWGEWRPDPDNYQSHLNDDGQILWANTVWLDQVLPEMGKQLVYEISLTKYRGRHSYSDSSGLKAVYVATRDAKAGLRAWHCKAASKE